MVMDIYTLQDPNKQYPRPKFKHQPQRLTTRSALSFFLVPSPALVPVISSPQIERAPQDQLARPQAREKSPPNLLPSDWCTGRSIY